MEISSVECEVDVKLEVEDTDNLNIALEHVINDIKLLQLRLTATHSYVEMLQKQLNEALALEQDLDKQLNRQLDSEMNIRKIILLNKVVNTESQPTHVVNSHDQQVSTFDGNLGTVQVVDVSLIKPLAKESICKMPTVRQLVNKPVTHKSTGNLPVAEKLSKRQLANRLTLVNPIQDCSNVTSCDLGPGTEIVDADLCRKTFNIPAGREIVDNTVILGNIQEPSGSSVKPYLCQTCGASFGSAHCLRQHTKTFCRGWPRIPLPSNKTTDGIELDQSSDAKCDASVADKLEQPGATRFIYTCPVCQVYCSSRQSAITRHVQSKNCQKSLNSGQESTAVVNNENKSVLPEASVIADVSNASEFEKPQPEPFHKCPTCQLCYQSRKSLRAHLLKSKCRRKEMLQPNNVISHDLGLDTKSVDADLCEKSFAMPTNAEIVDNSVVSCTKQKWPTSLEKPYVCQTCGASYACNDSLILHIRKFCKGWPQLRLPNAPDSTSDNKLVKSSEVECGASTTEEVEQIGAKRIIFKCPVCQVFCSTRQGTVTKHVRSKICQRPLDSEQQSAVAVRNENENVSGGSCALIGATNISEFKKPQLTKILHQCPTCQLCYQSQQGLRVHLLESKCCSKQMMQPKNTRMYSHKKDIAKHTKCPKLSNCVRSFQAAKCEIVSTSCFACGKVDATEWSVFSIGMDHICLDCEKLFLYCAVFDGSEYEEYFRPSHRATGKCFICLKCKKSFSVIQKIFHHLRSHTGYQPHICYRCGEAFSFSTALETHLLSHDPENSSAYFKCDICSKHFINEGRLKRHMLTHSDEKSFVCTVCGKAYAVAYELQIHMRNHTGIRPYACSMCPKTYIMSCHLKKHIIYCHVGKKMSKCPICSIEVYNLKRHHREIHLGIKRCQFKKR